MTDRVKGLTVVLDRDIRTDDIEELVNAIKMLKFVSGVELNVTNSDDYINRMRIETEFKRQLYDFVNSIGK